MNVKSTARRQQAEQINSATHQLKGLKQPPKGWIATLRGALGMSGTDVASRMDVTRNAVYQAEKNELEGAITLNQLQKIAEAMGARVIYAIVPENCVEEVIAAQARATAAEIVHSASTHMALEQQQLPARMNKQRIDALATELAKEMPPGFWKKQWP